MSATTLPGATTQPTGRSDMDRRTRALLEAPLLPMLLRLGAPNILLMLAQSATGLMEVWFIGHLGTDALAGASVVFPGMMLMQMISAGAMGGGISSSIARALGSGRRDDAAALVWHALIIEGSLGIAASIGVLWFGPELYAAMGARGPSLRIALDYSNIIYAGAILLWLSNGLASTLRGAGNMFSPAVVICGGAVVLVPIAGAMILGFGPIPAMGVKGGAWALIGYYAALCTAMGWMVFRGKGVVRPKLAGTRLEWRNFHAILRVGAIASLSSMQTNLTIMLTTGMVGAYGPAALAGFGTGARLEFLLVPISFGMGGPLVAIVGTNIGAGNRARALRAAWIGAAVTFTLTELIGATAALNPVGWLTLFDHNPEMLAAGSLYLRQVGPFYGFFGLGLVLYFASQGAGRMLWPVAAQFIRLVVAVVGGWVVLRLDFGLPAMFWALAAALALYGITVAASVAGGAWGPAPVVRAAPAR